MINPIIMGDSRIFMGEYDLIDKVAPLFDS
jgi:hypothetical protein